VTLRHDRISRKSIYEVRQYQLAVTNFSIAAGFDM
jgi:hypothetical protein